jgi:hypothetical protein
MDLFPYVQYAENFADFTVRFLVVHPFQDGNGRLSGILTNLLAGSQRLHFREIQFPWENCRSRQGSILPSVEIVATETRVAARFFFDLGGVFSWIAEDSKRWTQSQDWPGEKRAPTVPELSLKIKSLAKDHGRVTVAFLTGELKANRTLTIGATMHTVELVDRNHGLYGSLPLVQ